MAKSLRTWMLASVLIVWLTGTAAAGDLSLGVWPATGSQVWRISFPADGASELYYPHASTYFTASYENKPSHLSRLRVEGGLANGMKATAGSDSDWDYTRSSSLWYYGEFNTTGRSAFVNVDWVKPAGADREYFVGYGYRQNAFRMTDGVYYVENYASQSPPHALDGLSSTYTATYQGPHIGVKGKSALSPQVSVVGSVAYSPLALAQGHGWWNLRGLEFDHTGTAQMVDAYIGVRYALGGTQAAAVTAGYRYQYMSLYHGTENTSAEISWDKATSVQKGFYFSSEFRF
ncbi:hypothetical protein [Anaeroselena agilis]|uniref:Protochlamydia outer membrane protein domain-containing protein n=1 Tax=Anaeroselena agilis TaxID=3063788 RepID=A0ABU3NZ47_9FIRM|nr:hypothetical protein [Selenomonadales bacterium 4137-cl]